MPADPEIVRKIKECQRYFDSWAAFGGAARVNEKTIKAWCEGKRKPSQKKAEAALAFLLASPEVVNAESNNGLSDTQRNGDTAIPTDIAIKGHEPNPAIGATTPVSQPVTTGDFNAAKGELAMPEQARHRLIRLVESLRPDIVIAAEMAINEAVGPILASGGRASPQLAARGGLSGKRRRKLH